MNAFVSVKLRKKSQRASFPNPVKGNVEYKKNSVNFHTGIVRSTTVTFKEPISEYVCAIRACSLNVRFAAAVVVVCLFVCSFFYQHITVHMPSSRQ